MVPRNSTKEANVAVAVIIDNPDGSQEIYERVREHLGIKDAPAGGIFHAAGPRPDGGWRVIEVWESQEDAQRFYQERLQPAFEELAVPMANVQRQFWPVHNYMK
jgi:hypothetical protein